MRDFHSGVSLAQVFGPVVLGADNTPVAIDLQGFNAAELVLGIGIGGITFDGTNKIEFVLKHGDDSTVGNHVVVTLADVLGVASITNGIIKALVTAHAAAASYRFGYIGSKRFLSLLADFSGTHGTGTPLYASIAKGRPWVGPAANQA